LISRSIFIHAPNIRHGGGLLLLEQLLGSIASKNINLGGCFASNIKFKKFKLPFPSSSIKLYSASLIKYFYSNIHLYKCRNNHSVFLFFGNLPPFIKTKGFSVLFLHSKLLVEPVSRYELSFKGKINLIIRKALLKVFYKNIDLIIVQTPSMKRLSENFMPARPTIDFPFYNPQTIENKSNIKYDFLYPSFGYIYKNYDNLLKALILLANKEKFPKVIFALDPKIDQNLIDQITEYKTQFKLDIELLLDPPFSEILNLYQQSSCLIWPSLTESLGIPILDAINAQADVIAADLEYINDLLNLPPERKFNPHKPSSIAQTIENYLKNKDKSIISSEIRLKIFSSDEFVDKLMTLNKA